MRNQTPENQLNTYDWVGQNVNGSKLKQSLFLWEPRKRTN